MNAIRAILPGAVGVTHAAVSLFILLGLGAIAVGKLRGWRWSEGLAFRIAHFIAIALIMLRLTLGWACPFSVWEDRLRGEFVQGWVSGLAFRGTEERMFTLGCSAVFLATSLFGLQSLLESYIRRKRIESDGGNAAVPRIDI